MLLGNVADAIMEGASFGAYTAGINKHRYGHEEGAAVIAMESADALADIYTTLVYTDGECHIKAAMEGASCVEESSQAVIMEGVIGSAFTKIKEFFIKLKEKIKEFFHNVKRYLTGLFGDADKWVSKYESELTALKSEDLKGYKVKMYNYTIGDFTSAKELTKNHAIVGAKQEISKIQDLINKNAEKAVVVPEGARNVTEWVSMTKEEADKLVEEYEDSMNNTIESIAKELCGESVDSIEEFQKAMWSKCRDGAVGESSKEDVEVGGKIKTFISAIKTGKKTVSDMQSSINAVETSFNAAIKFINDIANKYDKGVDTNSKSSVDRYGDGGKSRDAHYTTEMGAKYAAEMCRKAATHASKLQTYQNSAITVKKQATTEMIGAYKSALLGAFGYARKNKAK